MKKLLKLTPVLLMFLFSLSATAQEKQKKIQTAEFEVSGICDMCKKRIENAALIKGVRLAEWDKINQKIKVVFVSKLTDVDKIKTAIAAAGYDTEGLKGIDEAYNKLPACCQYRADGILH